MLQLLRNLIDLFIKTLLGQDMPFRKLLSNRGMRRVMTIR